MQDFKNITAVVLAGGRKRFSLSEFFHQLEDLFFYKELYFRIGYKSLKRVRVKENGGNSFKPMVEYILKTLSCTDCVNRILVVGPEKEMWEKLNPELLAQSRIELIQQKESFGRNVKTGYDRAGLKHVLFVTADSPSTKACDIEEFIGICQQLHDQYDLIYPVVKESLLIPYYKLFPRPFFRMKPDNIYPFDYIKENDFREDGRIGFRITSMAFVNLQHVSVERIDEAYNLRKFYRQSSRTKLKKIFGNNLLSIYRRGLKMSEIEKMISDYEGLSMKIVGLSRPGTALDIDSTRDKRIFAKMRLKK